MVRAILSFIFSIAFLCLPAQAQNADTVWLQIEAQPNLTKAQERARAYADSLQNVAGFRVGSGWYAIALGPYAAADADGLLRDYKRSGQIPGDSFIAFEKNFREQFWPIGNSVLGGAAIPVGTVTAAPEPVTTPEPAQVTVTEPQVTLAPADETRDEALRAESKLSRDEKKAIQVALKWAGTYDGVIDGSFGRGTRGSMAVWQLQKGYEDTGILTTKQREELFADYNAILEGVGMQTVLDTSAGISIVMPTAITAFDKYEAPFAHYPAKDGSDAQVILISRTGDRDTLYGLYDIMQTLAIVPLGSEGKKNRENFTLYGSNDKIVSHTEAYLVNGAIKGFTLVWPVGDEERRTRILQEMQKSLSFTDDVLPESMGAELPKDLDLISGLEVRKAKSSQSGVFVSSDGTVLTTAEAVNSCSEIVIDQQFNGSVMAVDAAAGLALVKPNDPVAPLGTAKLAVGLPPLGSDIVVAGYSFGGILPAPSVTYGSLADGKGLNGEANVIRLGVDAQSGDVGGPVMSADGKMIGLLASLPTGARTLPAGVQQAISVDAITTFAASNGITMQTAGMESALDPEDLNQTARRATALVECW